MLLTASHESRLGRRVPECVVVVRVFGLGGGCSKYISLFRLLYTLIFLQYSTALDSTV